VFTTRRSFIRALGLTGVGAAALTPTHLFAARGRDVQPVIDACAKQDLLIGRLFPPLTWMARISIGTLDEMKRGLAVLDGVLRAGTGH
jgi:hypothetical protein